MPAKTRDSSPDPADQPRAGDIESMDFERASSELEAIIDRIESGELGLEDSLKQYERGVALHAQCRRILDRVEQRIIELNPDTAKSAEKTKG